MTSRANKRRWAVPALLIAALLVVATVLLVQEIAHARYSAQAVKLESDMRQYGVGIANYRAANASAERSIVPPTWTHLKEYLSETPSVHPEFDLPMLTPTEAQRVSDQSWEFVLGRWLSRMPEDHASASGEVIVGLIHERTEQDHAVAALLFADGRAMASHRDSLDRVRESLESDRRARDHLNLAPLPDEFRTWLLTGEPASVGDGTFIPPRLDGRD